MPGCDTAQVRGVDPCLPGKVFEAPAAHQALFLELRAKCGRHAMRHIGHTFRRHRGAVLTHPTFSRLTAAAGRGGPSSSKGRAMSDDITRMNDPDFLAEYSRTREDLEALTDHMRKLTEEFDRRAAAQWASVS
jgi:hypothetical protein